MDGRKYAISVATVLVVGLLIVPWIDFQDPEDRFRRNQSSWQENLASDASSLHENADGTAETPDFPANAGESATDQGLVAAEPPVSQRRALKRELLESTTQHHTGDEPRMASRKDLGRPVALPRFDLSSPLVSDVQIAGPQIDEQTGPVQADSQTRSAFLQVDQGPEQARTYDRPVPVSNADGLLDLESKLEAESTEILPSETEVIQNAPVAPVEIPEPAIPHDVNHMPAPILVSPSGVISHVPKAADQFTPTEYVPTISQAYPAVPYDSPQHCWSETSPCSCENDSGISIGGWLSAGFHTKGNDLFNDRPDDFALHQGWLYVGKSATQESPLGFRVDAVYGIDGTDTQAFGNNAGRWDYLNSLDFGSYSWALPQAFVEVQLGEWNLRAGHFFTLIGYEVVGAPDNFFYSHAMTMYNSEPFTHTGVLLNRTIGDFDVYAGWTLGWDTGFDQADGGSSWLGGFTTQINDDVSLSYFSTAGDLGVRGQEAYSQSLVVSLTLTESLTYVFQSDSLRVGSTGEDNVGINQYVTKQVSDNVSLGTRFEWWKGDVLTGYAPHGAVLPGSGSLSYFAATFGANIDLFENLRLRPEVRHDWSPAAGYNETYFGADAVWTF